MHFLQTFVTPKYTVIGHFDIFPTVCPGSVSNDLGPALCCTRQASLKHTNVYFKECKEGSRISYIYTKHLIAYNIKFADYITYRDLNQGLNYGISNPFQPDF